MLVGGLRAAEAKLGYFQDAGFQHGTYQVVHEDMRLDPQWSLKTIAGANAVLAGGLPGSLE